METLEQGLNQLALRLASGGRVTPIDLLGIGSAIEIQRIKKEFIPGARTVSGKIIDRKGEIFRIAEGLWGVSPGRWLELENDWLKSSRAKSGSKETEGKDGLDDIISAELLVRLIATIKLVADYNKIEGGRTVADEAVSALNLVIAEAVSKGRTRVARFGSQSTYSI